jgi:formylglycine-generating enzyme required for sulfatase activity
MQLAWIPSGEFMMGSPPDEAGHRADEGPLHPVLISRPFYLAVHETTVGNFRTFFEATRYQTEAERDGKGALRWDEHKRAWEADPNCTWRNPGWPQDDDQPVVAVSRYDALAFCYWLSRREGKLYRLPTEAEWEYACRAGTRTPVAGGLVLAPGQANFAGRRSAGGSAGGGSALGRTTKVGSFPANPWDLCDMHGNVWEWCADRFSPTYYRDSPARDPDGPEGSEWGVVRGGSWHSDIPDCRAARRKNVPRGSRRNDIGFRVVLEAGVR